MSSAFGRGNDVYERANFRLVTNAPTNRDIHTELTVDLLRGHMTFVVKNGNCLSEVATARKPENSGHRFIRCQMLDKLGDATFETVRLVQRFRPTTISNRDR